MWRLSSLQGTPSEASFGRGRSGILSGKSRRYSEPLGTRRQLKSSSLSLGLGLGILSFLWVVQLFQLLETLVVLFLTVSYVLWLVINVYRTLLRTGDGPDWSYLSKLASLLKKYYGNLGLESWSQAFGLLERLGDRQGKTYVAMKILNASTDDEVALELYWSELLAMDPKLDREDDDDA